MLNKNLLAGCLVALGGVLMLFQTQLHAHNIWVAGIALLLMFAGIALAGANAFQQKIPINWVLLGVIAIVGFLSTFFITLLVFSD